jgi:small subunit ribosomal protein S20
LAITWHREDPRSKRIGRVSRTAGATGSSGHACGSALKTIRTAIDGNDLAGAKERRLKQTISLIDKMASKGIIHRNAAGRYKSRLTAHRPQSIVTGTLG